MFIKERYNYKESELNNVLKDLNNNHYINIDILFDVLEDHDYKKYAWLIDWKEACDEILEMLKEIASNKNYEINWNWSNDIDLIYTYTEVFLNKARKELKVQGFELYFLDLEEDNYPLVLFRTNEFDQVNSLCKDLNIQLICKFGDLGD